MPITRIYADFNGLVSGIKNTERTAVVLDTFGSLRDLSNAGIILSDDLPLIAFDASDENEDLEGHGTAHYDRERQCWIVEFDELGVRYVPTKTGSKVDEFLCVNCQKGYSDGEARSSGASCGSCGTSVLAAYAAPKLAV